MEKKSFIVEQAELIARHWPGREHVLRRVMRALVPHPGTLITTLLVVGVVLFVQQAGALPLRAPLLGSDSTTTISYQGRLADSAGNPITNPGIGMQFCLYDTDVGGSPVDDWCENHTAVPVEDGLFHVLLGSIKPIPVSLLANYSALWLGITVDGDSEMTPREQIASVPYAMVASTVVDWAITTAKIADGTVTSRKVAPLYKSGVIWESFSSTAVNTWEDTGLQISFAASEIPVDGVVFVFATTSGRHSVPGGRFDYRLTDGTRARSTAQLTSGASQQWQATGLMAEFTVSANTAYTFKMQMLSLNAGTHMTQAGSSFERIVGIYFAKP